MFQPFKSKEPIYGYDRENMRYRGQRGIRLTGNFNIQGFCNHNRVVFEEMSSWTALTVHRGIKTTFQTKYI